MPILKLFLGFLYPRKHVGPSLAWRCEHCRFWRRHASGLPGSGTCHRHGPQSYRGLASWPETREDANCGDWKPVKHKA